MRLPWRELARATGGREDEVWSWVCADVRKELGRRAAALSVPCDVVVDGAPGEPAVPVDVALLELIRREEPDLTVMASHGRAGLSAFFVGSVTQEVVRRGGRPVLVTRSRQGGGAPPYRRILVPTDLSAKARRALPLAALLAHAFESRVTAVHAVSPGAREPGADEVRKAVAPELPAVSVRVERGAAWDVIVRVAAEEEADLVVMASKGHDSLSDSVIGSNAERVVRHAPCPVLVAETG